MLLGPRGTGKSTLIHAALKKEKSILWIDLLKPEDEERFIDRPSLLTDLVQAQKFKIVVIDEVQKVPKILDVVHELIESKGIQFILTGSSARKLKRGSANLLAGRALAFQLNPFTHLELNKDFDLKEALQFGLLPRIYFPDPHRPKLKWTDEEKTQYLQTYARTYLREEIQIEQTVRKILPFRKFLEVAAQMNGKIIEYANISRDIGVDDKTVAEYFQILEDTLIGTLLYPYQQSERKRAGHKPKFYLFDPGVKRALDRTLSIPLQNGTGAYGDAFEHFLILEFLKISQIINPDIRLSFFRTVEGTQEIDLIVEIPGQPNALVEIKSTRKVDQKTIAKLRVFHGSFQINDKPPMLYILCQEPRPREVDGIRILPWKGGIKEILGV